MTEITERCEWCGGDVIPGSTCPRSITCPRCGATPGQSCKRPSGHRASQLHARRIGVAEELDGKPGPWGTGDAAGHETQLAIELARG